MQRDSNNVHYCQLWNEVVATEFNPKKMMEWYREKMYRRIVAYETPFPINHLLYPDWYTRMAT